MRYGSMGLTADETTFFGINWDPTQSPLWETEQNLWQQAVDSPYFPMQQTTATAPISGSQLTTQQNLSKAMPLVLGIAALVLLSK